MNNPVIILEGARMFLRSIRVRLFGFKKYSGNADEICRKIVDECWNGKYFQVSSGHFSEFYTRDFGWCVDSFLKLGYKKKVLKTLEYVLDAFSKSGRVATTISPSGRVFDFPKYSPDSLVFLMKALDAAKAVKLISKYRDFLNTEIKKFYENVIDPKTGLVKKAHFSSIKDHAIRKSSCYDNVMAAMLSSILKRHKQLKNPLEKYDFKKIIFENFWTGSYFLDDLSGIKTVTGDANLFPFWTGVFSSKIMMGKAFKKIQEERLDRPFPLKYSRNSIRQKFLLLTKFFTPSYEKDTIWMHMGPLYVQMVEKIDRKKASLYKKKYGEVIEKYMNFLEVFDRKGKPYNTPFYYSDESMSWAANYLTFKK